MRTLSACRKNVKQGCDKKGLTRNIKASCGKLYAIHSMAERHDKVYHGSR